MSVKNRESSASVPVATAYEDIYRVPTSLSFLPTSWVPYAELMRLDRPAGYFAFYWHYIIGLSFAAAVSPHPPSPSSLLSTAVYQALWVIILRGITCTVNDIFDQEFDRQVARTKYRPLARRAVSSFQAWIFIVAQVMVGAAMSLSFEKEAIIYAVLMTAILSIYPLAKRVSDFPQVLLGFGLAIPVFFCCATLGTDGMLQSHSIQGAGLPSEDVPKLIWAEFCLYGAGILWTVTFDTVYAHQDINDDKKAGVKSLAVRLGNHSKQVLGALSCLQVVLLLIAGFHSSLSPIYYVLSCGGAGISLFGMILLARLDSPASCAWWFGPGSRFVGTSVTLGLLGEYLRRIQL